MTGFSVSLHKAHELFCLCAFCQHFFFFNVVLLIHCFYGFLFCVQHLRLLLALSAKSSIHLVERQLGHFGVGESLLACSQQHEGCPGPAAASRLQENISAIFWRPYLRGVCFPQARRLFLTHDFVSIPQMPQLPFPGRACVAAPAPKCPPDPRVMLLALPAPWNCLGSGFVTLSKVRHTEQGSSHLSQPQGWSQAPENPRQSLQVCWKAKIRDISKHCCVRSFLHGLQHSVELCFMLTATFLNVLVVWRD